MTKKEKQKIWDEILIDQWQKDGSVITAVTLFLKEVEPSLVGPSGFITRENLSAACQYMVSTGLSRCFDLNGKRGYFNCRGPVRAFIAVRSPKINDILWCGKYTSEQVVGALPQFKWRKQVSPVVQLAAQRQRAAKVMGPASLMVISARERDKRNDWDKVK